MNSHVMGGGNKARKALEYEKLIRSEGYNAIVTCGGIHSNHNRAMALMAMANGWECHLVYHGDKGVFMKGGGNADLVKMTNATYEFVKVDAISNAMDAKKAWLEAALEDGIEIHEPDSLEEYSGQFKLRMPRSLHRSLAEHSKREGISMNQYCVYLLSKNDAVYSK